DDGRMTTLTLRLLPPAPPLRLKAAPKPLSAGASVALEVEEPGVAMTWSLLPGAPGVMGAPSSPERARLASEVQGALLSMKVFDKRLAKARSEEEAAAARQDRMAHMLALLKAKGPAMGKLRQIDAVYHAPAAIGAETKVVVRGTAQDGRTI